MSYKQFEYKNDVSLDNYDSEQQILPLWEIRNGLPFEIYIYNIGSCSGPTFITKIDPKQSELFGHGHFSEGDKIIACYRSEFLRPLTVPYKISENYKKITIGASSYFSGSGHSEVQASNWDIRGVWLNNFLSIPLDIFYKGNLVARVFGYDGNTYLGGGSSSIYFDNDREGLNVGDTVDIYHSEYKGQKLFSLLINDEQFLNVDIGIIGEFKNRSNPDNSIYRIKDNNIVDINYYYTDNRYKTKVIGGGYY